MDDIRYKEQMLCMRASKSEDTVIRINDAVSVGGGDLTVIAGPCSVESEK